MYYAGCHIKAAAMKLHETLVEKWPAHWQPNLSVDFVKLPLVYRTLSFTLVLPSGNHFPANNIPKYLSARPHLSEFSNFITEAAELFFISVACRTMQLNAYPWQDKWPLEGESPLYLQDSEYMTLGKMNYALDIETLRSYLDGYGTSEHTPSCRLEAAAYSLAAGLLASGQRTGQIISGKIGTLSLGICMDMANPHGSWVWVHVGMGVGWTLAYPYPYPYPHCGFPFF
ncbi:hypothetical protein OG21DRAFT_1525782 [Imleria badia]|nr:hypothetical protein OG21DRAFT_1525782 [Imleria badia]